MGDTHKQIRVMIAGGERLFREGVLALINRARDMSGIGAAGDADEAIQMASDTLPDVILIGIGIPKKDPIEVIKAIKIACPSTAILVITDARHRYTVHSFMEADADGLVSRDTASDELLNVIRVVHTGHTVLSKDDQKAMDTINPPEDGENRVACVLHERELEVLKLAATGMSNKQIAYALCLSEHTVATHFFNIFRKLGVGSRLEATLTALNQGLFTIGNLATKE